MDEEGGGSPLEEHSSNLIVHGTTAMLTETGMVHGATWLAQAIKRIDTPYLEDLGPVDR